MLSDKLVIGLCFALGLAAIFVGGFSHAYSVEEEVISRCFFIEIVNRGPYCFSQYPFMASTIVWGSRVLGLVLILIGYLLARRVLKENAQRLGPPPGENI